MRSKHRGGPGPGQRPCLCSHDPLTGGRLVRIFSQGVAVSPLQSTHRVVLICIGLKEDAEMRVREEGVGGGDVEEHGSGSEQVRGGAEQSQ